jgi:hypothetical protein
MGDKEPKKAATTGVSTHSSEKAELNQSTATAAAPTSSRHLKARNIAREIFQADSPEQVIKGIPAQSLFLAIKQQGLLSSTDLLAITSSEQMRAMLDLDLWYRDSFVEDQLWDWLALADDEYGLTLLQRLLNCVDLKLLGILLCRYATAHIADEPTDEPPGPDYYTPDKGFTWIRVETGNADRDFLLNRFLALVFETSTEVFYQLISVPGVTTISVLEEDSYIERSKRLLADGVPDEEFAAQLNQPILPFKIKERLGSQERRYPIADVAIVSPILAEGQRTSILDRFLAECNDLESAESELCLLVNGALVHWGVFIDDYEEFLFTIDRVKSILTIGLENLAEFCTLGPADIYEKLSLKEIYGLGLFQLYELRKFAHKITPSTLESISGDPMPLSLVLGAKERIPVAPILFGHDGESLAPEEHSASDTLKTATSGKSRTSAISPPPGKTDNPAGETDSKDELENEQGASSLIDLTNQIKLRSEYRPISSLAELRAIKERIEEVLIRRVN